MTERLLGDDDLITPDSFMRPLVSEDDPMSDSHFTESMGMPINNFLWVPVIARLGPFWFGKTVGSFVQKVNYQNGSEIVVMKSHVFCVSPSTAHIMPGLRKHLLEKTEFWRNLKPDVSFPEVEDYYPY